jgi:hypothetical protein
MTLATYSELTETIEGYLDRTDSASEIQTWIRLVELEVQRKLGLRSQQLSVSGTLAGGSSEIETPVGILYPQQLVFDTEPPVVVEVVSFAQGSETAFSDSGSSVPTKATVWGVSSTYETLIRVWPTPPGDVDYTLRYTTGITALTAAAPTNYLLQAAADVYLYGALVHGYLFEQDMESAAIWRPLFDEQVRQVKKIEALARAKAGRLRVRPQFATP